LRPFNTSYVTEVVLRGGSIKKQIRIKGAFQIVGNSVDKL
jgi:hypothetical protein